MEHWKVSGLVLSVTTFVSSSTEALSANIVQKPPEVTTYCADSTLTATMPYDTDLHTPLLWDLYRPVFNPDPAIRLQVLLRRARNHQQAIDNIVSKLALSGSRSNITSWMDKNKEYLHNENLRLKICLSELEGFVLLNPETKIKSDVEMLRTQYQFFSYIIGKETDDGKLLYCEGSLGGARGKQTCFVYQALSVTLPHETLTLTHIFSENTTFYSLPTMNPYVLPREQSSIVNEYFVENNFLRAQILSLNEKISSLEAEIRLLGSRTPSDHVPTAAQIYAAPNDNALALPTVVESFAVMQSHFRRQGTLKQCSATGCHKDAFDQVCFRLGHMAWCRTHNRVITRAYTSCSVKAEERGDCVPVWWEQRHDWQAIVDRAFREGRIGNKGLDSGQLHAILFSPWFNPLIPEGSYAPMNDSWG
ncbi:hypothetical protein OPT61_g953 [Boeremia exigua]|uniref:Uncharacterized protein n=1 Tax=Boeremia exigua TaxID=749465 RepID=A0ACC2ISD6_9PLEO|nr:hypothetical protein OPT61_g953 [Boeremia exigua]